MPLPVKTGDRVLLFNRLKRLHLNHEITLALLYSDDSDLLYIDNISNYCKKIYTFKISKIRSILNISLKFFIDKSPLQVLYYNVNSVQNKIKRIYEEENFDLINAYLIRTIPFIENADVPVVLDMIDTMQLNFLRRICKSKSFFVKFFYRLEYQRIVRYENNLPDSIKKIIVVAREDQKYMPSVASVIPLGVDTYHFLPSDLTSTNSIIFSGNMSYLPNIQAILWFHSKCYPLIKEKVPGVKLMIAGASPSRDILKIQSQDVIVTGYVESLSELISKSSVSIAPMQSGSGMQNKILEAMSCAVPVVTTNIGLGSIGARHLDEIIVVDNSSKFANYVIEILLNPNAYSRLTQNARKFVNDYHSWDSHIDNLMVEFNDAIEI